MKARSVFLVILFLCFMVASLLPIDSATLPVKAAPVAQTTNGCGPEGFGGLVPDLWFTSACNRHDICYGTLGMPKATCDTRFYNDMKAICASRYPHWYQSVQLGACYTSAWTYYQAVKQFGQSAYDNAQRHAAGG